ncbi:MAG: AMP-binding protein, partial [Planctomycetes bacterium]|nr:AMP-binding protein [Planctomycetota bacterium]
MDLPEHFATLRQLVERLGADRPGGPALRAGGRTLQRGPLAEIALTLARGWRAHGYAPGNAIAIAGEGGPAFVHALFSAACAGLVPLLIDPRLTAEETAVVFERARPRALAVCQGTAAPFDGALPKFDFDADGCAELRRASAGKGASCENEPLRADPAQPAVLLVTSGTSGAPRVVAL